jgi:uncharacterized membrane protein
MKSSSRDGVLRGGYVWLVRLLLLGAAGVSAYLLSISMSGGSAVGCGPGSSCDEVLKSPWAYVFKAIPVSALALLLDVALLLTTFSCGPKSSPQQRRKAWELLFPGALLVLGGALWFVALQLFIVRKICPFCMAVHACGAAAAVMLLLRLPMRNTTEKRDKDPALPRATVTKLAVAALLAVVVLAAVQIGMPRKTYTDKAAAPTIPVNNVIDVFGGQVKLDLDKVPVLGSSTAPQVLVSLHDYSCHHCAQMHSHLVQVFREFSNEVVVATLPMPLDGKCNPAIKRTPPAHTNACAYAKLGLAVWRAKPAAMHEFDDWFFERFNASGGFNPQPPSFPEAQQRAEQLVGKAALETAMRDPWIEQQIGTNAMIFEISMNQYKNHSMPQFIMGTNVLSGKLPPETLRAMIAMYAKPNATAQGAKR